MHPTVAAGPRSRRKTEAVLRLLRGEDLDTLSRELGITAATISSWRDQFWARSPWRTSC
jgi:transposase-like protein